MSNFWEVGYLGDTSSKTNIRKLKANFARRGIPEVLISDNGPQFTSHEFKKFSKDWEFNHITHCQDFRGQMAKQSKPLKLPKLS